MRPGLLLLLPGLLLPPRAEAHDLWVIPHAFHLKAGEILKLSLNTGDRFPLSEVAVAPDRVAAFLLRRDSQEIALTDFKTEGTSLVAETRLRAAGLYLAAVELNPRFIQLEAREFEAYLAHEGLHQIAALRAQRGESQLQGRERYRKYGKALIQVGEGEGTIFSRVVGHRLEFVPERDPYRMVVGEVLPVRVLFDGQPLVGVQVVASYEGYRGPGPRLVARTRRDGQIQVPLIHAGRWYLKAVHMLPLVGDPQADWESFWATLTFELPEVK